MEFINFKSIKVCNNLRIPRHKVFQGTVVGSKSIIVFYGFKLHIIMNNLS
ncbi:IS982 family transposase, partial [Vibrio parahaemolyticus]|nr:IS982 family transposase [Vibrio parahaemolyticus]EJG0791091.1 IS982 family transposase [Vibrio parahaemolyticus]